jgi:hypothetical protein
VTHWVAVSCWTTAPVAWTDPPEAVMPVSWLPVLPVQVKSTRLTPGFWMAPDPDVGKVAAEVRASVVDVPAVNEVVEVLFGARLCQNPTPGPPKFISLPSSQRLTRSLYRLTATVMKAA